MIDLKRTIVKNWKLENGEVINAFPVFYQLFGKELGTAPVVLVNHALTGNSNVTGETGWWKNLIGKEQLIDVDHFTIVSINIPGNGFDGGMENLIDNYKDFTIRDIAGVFWLVLREIGIKELYAAIGGSLGGAIAWEMAVIEPQRIEHLIPIATDWKATDWMVANVLVQDAILNHSINPIEDARMHAMLLYRTPESLAHKFIRSKHIDKGLFEIEGWLIHHGDKLKSRFQLSSYKLMNHLLKTNDITRNRTDFENVLKEVKSTVHIVSIDSDAFFVANEDFKTYEELKKVKKNVFHYVINSIHGHDAFLIEFEQLNRVLKNVFNIILCK